MGMDAGITFWYGIRFKDIDWDDPKYDDLERLHERVRNEEAEPPYEWQVDGRTLHRIEVVWDEVCGFGVALYSTDWDYGVQSYSEIQKALEQDAFFDGTRRIVEDVLVGYGLDHLPRDIYFTTWYR